MRRVESQIPETLALTKPSGDIARPTVQRYELASQASTRGVLRELGDAVPIDTEIETADAYAVAVDMAGRYRLSLWLVRDALCEVYPDDEIPLAHLDELARQVEAQVSRYKTEIEEVEVALALIHPSGFREEKDRDGKTIRTAEISYHKDREQTHLWRVEDARSDYPSGFGFHYTPYNFDSLPEKDLLMKVLNTLRVDPADIEDVYFTGAITDRAKTDFVVEYKGEDGRWHGYTPDFLIRRKPAPGKPAGSGKVLIVEVKSANNRAHPTDGENGTKAMAVREWAALNPQRMRYEMIFADAGQVPADRYAPLRDIITGG